MQVLSLSRDVPKDFFKFQKEHFFSTACRRRRQKDQLRISNLEILNQKKQNWQWGYSNGTYVRRVRKNTCVVMTTRAPRVERLRSYFKMACRQDILFSINPHKTHNILLLRYTKQTISEVILTAASFNHGYKLQKQKLTTLLPQKLHRD